MSEAKHTCPERIFRPGSFRGHVCGRNAAYEHNGVFYCKTHHPPTIQAKREEKYRLWKEQRLAMEAKRQTANAKAAEAKHRADRFPELVEALQKIVALEDTEENEWDAVERVLPEAIAIARAAIAKAEGRS